MRLNHNNNIAHKKRSLAVLLKGQPAEIEEKKKIKRNNFISQRMNSQRNRLRKNRGVDTKKKLATTGLNIFLNQKVGEVS